MAENPQNDSTQVNEFILGAALQKASVFDSYKKLCETRKDEKIDYVDFEWKYYQYFHGNFDLTIERSPENSSPLTFSNLPMDALEQIVGKLDLVDSLLFRKVSHDIRNLVDTSEVYCKGVGFSFGLNFSDIHLEGFTVEYEKNGDSGCTIYSTRRYNDTKKYERNQSSQEAMIADYSTFLKNPKLKIGHISISLFVNANCFEFLEFLKTLNFQLNVRSIDFYTDENDILSILQFLKPKTLENISFSIPQHLALAENSTVDRFIKIVETEQWKKAKRLECDRLPNEIGAEELLHFEEIKIKRSELTDKDLIVVRDILLKPTLLKSCSLEVRRFYEFIMHDAGQFVAQNEAEDENQQRMNRIMSQNSAYDAETGRFPIPNSRDYFQLKIERDYFLRKTMTIKKISGN